jgi:hypothetical protein
MMAVSHVTQPHRTKILPDVFLSAAHNLPGRQHSMQAVCNTAAGYSTAVTCDVAVILCLRVAILSSLFWSCASVSGKVLGTAFVLVPAASLLSGNNNRQHSAALAAVKLHISYRLHAE